MGSTDYRMLLDQLCGVDDGGPGGGDRHAGMKAPLHTDIHGPVGWVVATSPMNWEITMSR
jgi:hypothetical protein